MRGWAVLLMMLASMAPARAEPAYARFTTWLRAAPDAEAAVMDEIRAGQSLERVGCDGGWCRVAAGRVTGFVAAAVLDDAPLAGKLPSAAGCFPAQHATPAGPLALRICPAQ